MHCVSAARPHTSVLPTKIVDTKTGKSKLFTNNVSAEFNPLLEPGGGKDSTLNRAQESYRC